MDTQGVLIVGCGDLGLRVARRLRAQGRTVHALVRTEASVATLARDAIAATAVDLDRENWFADAAEVYWFAPPPTQGTIDPRLHRWLAGLRPRARRIVYVSTSGVYGDCSGRWIAEDEPLKPQTDRGRRRLDAEQALQEFAAATRSERVILRVPGIYGPGRMPIERLRKGLPVVEDGASDAERRWTNRIHVEDLAEAALAAMARGHDGAAYNTSDGNPTTMSDYFVRCARLLGLPEPPRVPLEQARAQLGPALMSFLEESKRLLNRRMLDELGVVLRYPDLAAGLPSCLP